LEEAFPFYGLKLWSGDSSFLCTLSVLCVISNLLASWLGFCNIYIYKCDAVTEFDNVIL